MSLPQTAGIYIHSIVSVCPSANDQLFAKKLVKEKYAFVKWLAAVKNRRVITVPARCSFHSTTPHVFVTSIRELFEPPADTGSVLFSYFTCLHITTFTFLSLFALVETITLKIWGRPMSWPAKCSLPVAVRGSKTLRVSQGFWGTREQRENIVGNKGTWPLF